MCVCVCVCVYNIYTQLPIILLLLRYYNYTICYFATDILGITITSPLPHHYTTVQYPTTSILVNHSLSAGMNPWKLYPPTYARKFHSIPDHQQHSGCCSQCPHEIQYPCDGVFATHTLRHLVATFARFTLNCLSTYKCLCVLVFGYILHICNSAIRHSASWLVWGGATFELSTYEVMIALFV